MYYAYTAGGNENIVACKCYTLDNSLSNSDKSKHIITTRPSNCILGHLFQKKQILCSHRNVYMNVSGSLICISQKT